MTRNGSKLAEVGVVAAVRATFAKGYYFDALIAIELFLYRSMSCV